jgi:hypothetical protein
VLGGREALSQAATADLDISIVGQLALAELALDDALEAGPL